MLFILVSHIVSLKCQLFRNHETQPHVNIDHCAFLKGFHKRFEAFLNFESYDPANELRTCEPPSLD